MNKVVHQVSQAINLASDSWLERVGWWIMVSPKLIFFIVAVKLGFYEEEMEDD